MAWEEANTAAEEIVDVGAEEEVVVEAVVEADSCARRRLVRDDSDINGNHFSFRPRSLSNVFA